MANRYTRRPEAEADSTSSQFSMHDGQGYSINMHVRSSPGLQMGLEVAHT